MRQDEVDITFITGNVSKAAYLARHLKHSLKHRKLELDEIQSTDPEKVVEHKARQAYSELGSPVLVNDVSLSFRALGHLPGPYIRWFEAELGYEKLCRLLDPFGDRSAVARSTYGFYDGSDMYFFKGILPGVVADHPKGEGGFGWDPIFIPEGYTQTRAEMSHEDDLKTYLILNPFEEMKNFFNSYRLKK